LQTALLHLLWFSDYAFGLVGMMAGIE